MAPDTVDMSVLLRGEPRRATFTPGGREYLFPVDISIPEGIRFQDLTDRWQKLLSAAASGEQVKDSDDATIFEESYALIVELARREDPTIEDVEIVQSQVPLFFQSVYGGLDLKALVSAGEADPTKPRRRAAGTTKTRSTSPRKTAAKKPSRRSSRS
jgi:hypothetical protein